MLLFHDIHDSLQAHILDEVKFLNFVLLYTPVWPSMGKKLQWLFFGPPPLLELALVHVYPNEGDPSEATSAGEGKGRLALTLQRTHISPS